MMTCVKRCASSIHMRQQGSKKGASDTGGLVRSLGIVVVFPRQQGSLEAGEIEIAVVALPELATTRAIESARLVR